MKKILICVGTRPNLIKITQFDRLLKQHKLIEYKLLHTGQHYDYNMNSIFFEQLGLRQPDLFLNIKEGSQIEIIGQIMAGAEKFMKEYKPDLVIVPGDVNSTFACGFVARYLGIPLAHLESGLRSFDKTMPEENNRVLVDSISDYYFVTEQSGVNNLLKENADKNSIFLVGNTMIDTLVHSLPSIEESPIIENLSLDKNNFFLYTFHRPINVDFKEQLQKLISLVEKSAETLPVVFPVHPRTRKRISEFGLDFILSNPNIHIVDPLGYFEFLKLVKYSRAVITDSGGIQEESTYLGVPCLTIRPNTERPVTITAGTNTLLPLDLDKILQYIRQIMTGNYKKGEIPVYWDGNATERIVDIIANQIFKL
ncbi:MAG: UDP-N-acetylglucosamine 2-epimerase (non-hydrolyzing) [Bacteroidales bacterium]